MLVFLFNLGVGLIFDQYGAGFSREDCLDMQSRCLQSVEIKPIKTIAAINRQKKYLHDLHL